MKYLLLLFDINCNNIEILIHLKPRNRFNSIRLISQLQGHIENQLHLLNNYVILKKKKQNERNGSQFLYTHTYIYIYPLHISKNQIIVGFFST